MADPNIDTILGNNCVVWLLKYTSIIDYRRKNYAWKSSKNEKSWEQ